MKKIIPIVLVLMLMASVTSFALAEEADDPAQETDSENETNDEVNDAESSEDTSFEDETQRQIRVMKDPLGAKIRVLQLEKAILVNILKGEKIIDALTELGFDTTDLASILDDLKLILEELQDAREEDSDEVDIVLTFVDLKDQARTLTKDFRDTIRQLLDEETINQIKEQLQFGEEKSDELQEYSMEIQNSVRLYNGYQLSWLFSICDEETPSLLGEYLKGDVSLEQVKLHLYKIMNQMTEQKQYTIVSQIKEETIKNKIQAYEAMMKYMGYDGQGQGSGAQP